MASDTFHETETGHALRRRRIADSKLAKLYWLFDRSEGGSKRYEGVQTGVQITIESVETTH